MAEAVTPQQPKLSLRLKRTEREWLEDFAFVVTQGFITDGIRSGVYRAALEALIPVAERYKAEGGGSPSELRQEARKAIQALLAAKGVPTGL